MKIPMTSSNNHLLAAIVFLVSYGGCTDIEDDPRDTIGDSTVGAADPEEVGYEGCSNAEIREAQDRCRATAPAGCTSEGIDYCSKYTCAGANDPLPGCQFASPGQVIITAPCHWSCIYLEDPLDPPQS